MRAKFQQHAVEPPRRTRSNSDPLAIFLEAPPGETPEEREQREQTAWLAKKRSDAIDEQIRNERNEKKKGRPQVKILLLGQSESGKSTTLKQFQLMHTPAAFHAERIAWRAVIYLNLVRSIRRILEAISPDEDDEDGEVASSLAGAAAAMQLSSSFPLKVSNYEPYSKRLEPLIELEERLTRLLSSPGSDDEATRLETVSSAWEYTGRDEMDGYGNVPIAGTGRPTPTLYIPPSRSYSSSSPILGQSSSEGGSKPKKRQKEITVHTTTNWKKAFALGTKAKSPMSAHTNELVGWWEDPDDPVHPLNACAPAMMDLWRDPVVKECLKQRRLRLEESSGFYLDEIPRITAKMYIPRDEDVLKARLKTMGVIEHVFTITESGTPGTRGIDWHIYDVGGSRNQRQAWASYFDDVNAVIFLAPIAAFDQVLSEDNKVNRLEDSLLLWKSLVMNQLLSQVNIVLMLNKCDLLQTKLEAGVRLRDHMISYGDRSNDYEHVSKYFRQKFGALHQQFSLNRERELYIHLTSVTDTRKTSTIISNVQDLIVKSNLKSMRLM